MVELKTKVNNASVEKFLQSSRKTQEKIAIQFLK